MGGCKGRRVGGHKGRGVQGRRAQGQVDTGVGGHGQKGGRAQMCKGGGAQGQEGAKGQGQEGTRVGGCKGRRAKQCTCSPLRPTSHLVKLSLPDIYICRAGEEGIVPCQYLIRFNRVREKTVKSSILSQKYLTYRVPAETEGDYFP